jgi:hypothetical protein
MNQLAISAECRELVERCLGSVLALEVFFLLHRDASRMWSPSAVAGELGAALGRTERVLEQLGVRGIAGVKLGQEVLYSYAPASKELADMIDRCSVELRTRRVAVLELLEQKPRSPIGDFADAFRIRKKGKKNG